MLWSLVLGVVVSVVGSSAAGGEPSWEAEARCPDAEAGRRLTREALGGPLPSEVPVAIRLAARGAGYEATVRVGDSSRTLTGDDCQTLARAAVLVVAVSIDAVEAAASVQRLETTPAEPTVVARPMVPEPSRAPSPGVDEVVDDELSSLEGESSGPATSERRGRAGAADAEARGPRPSSEHWLGLGAGAARSRIPPTTAALWLRYAWHRRALRLEVSGHYDPPRAVTYPGEAEVGGRFQSVAASMRACFVPDAGRLDIPLCGGVEGGAILGRGTGVVESRRPVGPWVGAVVGAVARIHLHSRVALFSGLDLLLGLRRPAFHVGLREPLFRSPAAGIRAGIGVEIRVR